MPSRTKVEDSGIAVSNFVKNAVVVRAGDLQFDGIGGTQYRLIEIAERDQH
jgi:hypothetical protein